MAALISPDEALRLVIESAMPLAPVLAPLADSHGWTLAEPIRAVRDFPPFDRAQMDGYAMLADDAGKTLPVMGEAPAGTKSASPLATGQAIEIMTGAPVPTGADAVAPHEDCARSGKQVTLPASIKAGQNITFRGRECPAGDPVAAAGQTVTPLVAAILAANGIAAVKIIAKPRIAIVTTGDELARAGDPADSQIRDSNSPMLAAMALQLNLTDIARTHAADSMASLLAALEAHADRDIVILTGGVSMGKYDLVPAALESIGARLVFHKVSQRPGKPLLFAARGSRLFFGLPGNPLSCHLGFHRYIRPAIRKMAGLDPAAFSCSGILLHPFANASSRTVFQLARADWSAAEGEWHLAPLPGKTSADLFSASPANALLRFDPSSAMQAGSRSLFEWL